jgi:class 3 adenylate cyclase
VTDPQAQPTIDELLDRAFEAIGRGERATANTLAEQVLAIDRRNVDAEDLLAAPVDQGEIRRLTIMFADLVESTALSSRIEPETYRTVVGRYREHVRQIVDRYEGHIASIKGDGLLIVFGHPKAHENDAQRAVHAGLNIAREVALLSEWVQQRFGFTIQVRVGVHRGVVYLDLEQDDVYGLAANMAARVTGLAPPGAVVVSAAVEPLTREHFEFQRLKPQTVKGIAEPVDHYQVLSERAGGARTPLWPLVGRERELAHIEKSWENARSAALRTVGLALCGEAGIGKSRLAAAAVELAEQSGAVVLELTGSPLHTDVGLHPVRQLLERQCGIDRGTAPSERIVRLTAEVSRCGLDPATTVPLLAPVLAISPKAGYEPASVDGAKLYRRIAGAVRAYLLARRADGPALVVAEDMHWFDQDTTEIVRSLLNEDSGRLLVLMTTRDAAWVPQGQHVDQFVLAPLTDRETDELIEALHPGLGADARGAVRRRCDGIPLFIEEVVAKLKERSGDTAESGRVPDSLYEALIARLRSSRDAVRVVEGAAVIGSPVDRRLLESVLEIGQPDLDRVMGELCAGRVLEPVDEDTWRFRHELLRDIAAELSPPSRRRLLHSRVADALLASTPETNTDWPLIAGHFERAERYDAAASAYQKASGVARRRGALHEARSYLGHAISQIERAPAGPERDRREISLRQRRGFLFYAAEGAASQNAAAEFERCLQLSGTDLTDDLFATLTALYGHYAVRADLRRAHQVLQAVEAGIVKGQVQAFPTITAGFGMVAWYRGEFDSAREQLETAAARRHNVGRALTASWFMANEPVASIHTHLALARYIKGDLSGADDELVNSAQRCDAVGLPQGPFSRAYARQMETLIRIESGDLNRAAEVVVSLISDARKNSLDSWVMLGSAQQMVVDALLTMTTHPTDRDALARHIAAVTGLVDGWRALGLKSMITFYDAVIARLLLTAGQPADARERVDVGLSLAEETGMQFYDAELLRIRAHTHNDADQRCDGLRSAIQFARKQGATIFELRAAADDFELRGEPARQGLRDSILRFSEESTWPELARARALLG